MMQISRRPLVGLVAVFISCGDGKDPGPAALPNILHLFPDQWRWDWAGFHPELADLRMPNLKAITDSGTRFTHVYTPSPWCVPARSCLASGKFFDSSTILNGKDLPTDTPTWYKRMQSKGYHTIVVGKDDLTQSRFGTGINGSRHAHALGLSDWFRMQDKFVTYAPARPWDQFGAGLLNKSCGLSTSNGSNLFQCNRWCYGSMYKWGACCEEVAGGGLNCPRHDQVGDVQGNYIDNYITAQAERLLDRAPVGKPWILHVSFPGPHPPFVITEAMNRSIANRSFPPSSDNAINTKAQQLQIRQQYAAEIENLDALMGSLLDKLRARGDLENTIVTVTSDHGEQLGDNNAYGKKKPWEPSVRVPLVVAGPGMAAGRVVSTPVSTMDVIGTFLDHAGLDLEALGLDYRSLRSLLEGSAPDEETYLRSRPFVPSGLTVPPNARKRTKAIDFRIVVKRMNSTLTLKVVCCPTGCPGGNSRVPRSGNTPQFLAFNVADSSEDAHDAVDLGGGPEARQLAKELLPRRYLLACLPGAENSTMPPAAMPISGRSNSTATPVTDGSDSPGESPGTTATASPALRQVDPGTTASPGESPGSEPGNESNFKMLGGGVLVLLVGAVALFICSRGKSAPAPTALE